MAQIYTKIPGCSGSVLDGTKQIEMKTPKVMLGIVLLFSAFINACLASGSDSHCAKERINIAYAGVEKLNLWGEVALYGKLDIRNDGDDAASFYTSVYKSNYHVINPAYVELQKNENGSWVKAVKVLEDYMVGPHQDKISKGDGSVFYFHTQLVLNESIDSTQQYRVKIKDAHECEFESGSFVLTGK